MWPSVYSDERKWYCHFSRLALRLTLFCNILISAICDKGKGLFEDDLFVDNTDVVIQQI